jgi:predicted site-specific integrase-resolvase
MLLVERHLIKSNHAFYQECDNLSFLAKNLYNAANYIYRQNFFANQKTDAVAVYHQLKNGTDYKALPAKISQEVLRMLFKNWQSYYAAHREYLADPSKFKAPPKIPNYKGSIKDRSNGRYVVSYNNQAISKRELKKGIIHPSQTNIYLTTQVKKAEQVRIIPKKKSYIIEVVYEKEITVSPQPPLLRGAKGGWQNEGKITAIKTPSGQRRYDVESYTGKSVSDRQTIIYARVSSRAQQSDLNRQVAYLSELYPKAEIISEIGGGLNFKRKKLISLLERVMQGSVERIIVAHKDRLARFGFDWLEWFCKQYNCGVLVLNERELSPEAEMVEDILAILHCFSSRLYGFRKYKNIVKEDQDLPHQRVKSTVE